MSVSPPAPVSIVVMEGDGIGPEITAATLEVLDAANAALGLDLIFEHAEIGLASLSKNSTTLTDAVVALDIATGAIKWAKQVTAGDAYTMACTSADTTNCPQGAGPDHDFGQSAILLPLATGKRILVAGTGPDLLLDERSKEIRGLSHR